MRPLTVALDERHLDRVLGRELSSFFRAVRARGDAETPRATRSWAGFWDARGAASRDADADARGRAVEAKRADDVDDDDDDDDDAHRALAAAHARARRRNIGAVGPREARSEAEAKTKLKVELQRGGASRRREGPRATCEC